MDQRQAGKIYTLAIVITHPLRRDFILRTGLFQELANHPDVRLVVATHCLDIKELEAEFKGERVFFEAVTVPGPHSLLAMLQDWRTIARVDPNVCDSIRYFYNQARAGSRSFAFKKFILSFIPKKWRQSEAFWEKLEDWLVRMPLYDTLFAKYNFDAVLVPTPGMKTTELPWLVCARRRGLPALAIDNIYDNLVTKYFDCRHVDKLLAWSEMMKADLVAKRGISPETIAVTGPARVDIYAEPKKVTPREQFLRSLRLDPEKKLLTFVFSTQNRSPQYPPNKEFAKDILELINANALGAPAQLLVRLSFGDNIDDYRDLLKEGGVAIDASMAGGGDKSGTIDEKDFGGHQQYFLDLLAQSSVFINTTSSSTIEAACMDVPLVWLSYAEDLNIGPLHLSLKDRINFHAHRWLLATGGVTVVTDKKDLAKTLRAYLDNPTLHHAGRERIVAEQAGVLDGQAGQRSAEAIYNFIARR